jgi:hypothetical protein
MLRPLFGARLATIVFFGYRIAAITSLKDTTPADPFTAAFVAGIVGLFADRVLRKLQDTINALLPSKVTVEANHMLHLEGATYTPVSCSIFPRLEGTFQVAFFESQKNAQFSLPLSTTLAGWMAIPNPRRALCVQHSEKNTRKLSGTVRRALYCEHNLRRVSIYGARATPRSVMMAET